MRLLPLVLVPWLAVAQADALMPVPAELSLRSGALLLTPRLHVALTGVSSPRLERAVTRFTSRLARQTGIPFAWAVPDSVRATRLAVRVRASAGAYPLLGDDESYVLEAGPGGVTLEAPTDWGALHGLETLLQLAHWGPGGWEIPAVRIADRPRFQWRGLNLDAARHFLPVEDVLRTLDGLAAVKMNVLHWHLTEDQGFRVESRAAPRLHTLGSDGRFYTQEEVRRVIEYAADRGIRVVPEFDVPGHTTSWLVGHPEVATAPGPYELIRRWGMFDPVLDPTRDTTYSLLDAFLGEMAALFPDPYLHIGGDEVSGVHWSASPAIQQYIQANGLADNHGLQAHFNQRLLAILTRHGKRMVGWDEIFHPDLPRNIVIQSWRGQRSLAAAARAGYQGILSSGWYLDLYHSAGEHYRVDPLANETADLTRDQQALVLGGEACMWAEFVTPEILDHRVWPRTAAVAERLWSPGSVTDVADMYRRLDAQSVRLEWLGLTHRTGARRMRERLAAGAPMDAIEALAGAVEPVKGYERHRFTSYTQQTPLNRLIDAIPSESDAVRRLNGLVDRFLADPDDVDAVTAILWQLNAWRDQYQALRPWFARSASLAELEATSEAVAALARRGLWALGAADEEPPDLPAAEVLAGAPMGLLIVAAAPIARLSGEPRP